MKKFLRTGKKALAVFMAVMMVMTAWVFFEPMEAGAAAGSYYVVIKWSVTDRGGTSNNNYTGKSSISTGSDKNNCMGFSLFYKTNNGTGSTGEVYWYIGHSGRPCGQAQGSGASVTAATGWTDSSTGQYQAVATVPGFPTEVFAMCDYAAWTQCGFSIDSIQVGASSSSTLKTLWSGKVGMNSSTNPYYATINASGVSGNPNDGNTSNSNVWSANYPYASSMTVTASPTSVTAPSTSGATAVTSKVTASATDQYGVTMFDPTWKVSSNISGAQGFSVSPTTSSASTTASVTYLANRAGTTDSQTLTVTATWSTPSSSTYSSRSKTATITVNDASYTAKFTGLKDSNGNAIADVTRTAQKYGHTPTAATTASSYSIGDYDYSFTGWSPALGPITANTTYTAQYSSTFEAADLTELKAKIAVANQAKASSTWTTNGYTTGSMNNLNTALTAANNLNKSTTGRTQQDAVNSAAQALQDAIDALELVTHTVKFYDASGAIISVQEIVHEQGATAPTNNPTKDDDEAYHYTWKGWDTAYNSVITDLEIHPTYNSVAHSWGTATTTAANCQHGAGTTKTCTVCGRVSYSYDDTLGDHNKSTSYVIDTQPTCTATGSGHYYCTICNANLETVTIPAKGHSYAVTVTKEATCTQTGTREIKCTVCGDKTTETIPLKQHNYVKNNTVAATCQHSGYDVMKCSVCGDTYNKYLGNATNNHSWTITSAPSATHGYDTVTGSCSVCGASFTKEVAEGHSFTEYEVTSMPTCSTVGTLTIKCSDASCTASYQVDIPATGVHNIETVYTAPSCTATGSIVNNCKDCSYSQTVETIEKLTHSYDYVRTEPTCTTAGSLVQTCSLCGNKKTTVLPATGHKAVTLPAVAATCNTKGKTEGSECGVCHAVLVAQTETAKTAHSFTGAVTTIDATCEKDGAKLTKCANCDAQKIETITKTGHSYTDNVVAPTCTSIGYTEHTCSKCGSYYKDNAVNMIDHAYVLNAEKSLAPTCTGKGMNVYDCSVCGHEKVETVKANGHNPGDWQTTVTQTCTGKGYQVKICVDCGLVVERHELAALGHNFKQSAVVPATCEAGGYTLNVCDRSGCGAQQITNKTAALGHGWTTVDHAADCTHSAYTEYICANDASHNYKKYDETKPALGHDFTGTETVTKAATCTADGTKTIACTRCSEVQTVTIPKLGHNYAAGAAQAPSCTTSGYTPYTCSRCSDTYNVYDDSKPATGHAWGEWVVTKAPTETNDGEQTRTCSKCGATETAPVPATSHTLVEDTSKTVAPTCTTDGQKVYKCTATHPGQSGACTYTVTKVVPKLGHNLSTTKTDATCTADGKVITSCSRCDYKAETVIPATGHSYTNAVTTEPTCTTAGVRTYTCQHDRTHTYTEAIEKLPHDFVAGTPVAATCTESAYTPYKCSKCDEAYVKITAPANGHNYAEVAGSSTATCTAAGTKTLKCAACDSTITVAVPALGHDYQKTASTTATCAAAATETYKCSRCDASYTISVGDKTTAHDWNDWTVVENATYESLGYKTRTCKVCGKLEVETIPCLGDHVFDTETDRKDATCTEDGYIDYACSKHSDCGATSRVLLPKTGHDLTTATTPAGCTTEGKVVTSCSKCDYKIETAIPATGHAWGKGVVAKQPTCTAKGEMTYTCSACRATKTEEIATNPNAHVYTAGAVTAATCVTPELTTYSCACGKSEIKQTAAANGHSWNAEKTVDKEATCIDAGSKSTHCANCEATKDAEVIPATGHSLKTQKVDPTCTTGGYTAEVCKVCGYLDSVTAVDPLGHDYAVTATTDATCTEGATETKTCQRDGCTETVTTITSNPTGHDWGEWFITTPATETTKGEKTRQCRNNTSHFETCEIPTIGHKWDSGTIKKAATCYEVGTMLYTCTGCENCVKAGTMATLEVKIPKTEHTYTQVTTPATCTTAGSTVVKCSVAECGDVAQTVTLPATGHTLERDTAKDVAPTCDTEGSFAYKCKNCDYTETITRDALGHDYSTTAVTVTEPTCTTDGIKAYKCTRCDAKIETAIPKTGHDFSITEVIAPTCTEKGYTIKRCANCTENYVVSDSFKDAKGHAWGEWTTVTEPTNDADGLRKRVCGTDPTHVEYAPIPMLGHEWNDGEVTIPAGCTTEGVMTYTCIKAGCPTCNGTPATRTEVIPATGHNMKAVQTAATCTTPPYQTWTCDNGCGHSYIVVTGTAIGHNYTKTTTAATCEADGNEHYVCGNCGHEYDVVLPKLGHNFKTKVIAPTCSAYGYTTYTCQNDPTHTYQSDFVATTAHTYAKDDAQSVAATCESKGYDVMVCSGCGDSYKVITDSTGHDWNDGEITTDATCTANGVKTYTCNNDDTHTYTEVIPATGHTYGAGVVEREASDGNSGLISYTCSKCNDKFYEEYVINSTEHTWNVEVKQNPTCTEKGVSAYTCIDPDCAICAHGVQATFTKQTAALGHNYVGVETTAPTCTETGVMTYTCSRCDATYDEVIPATGHNYDTNNDGDVNEADGVKTSATCTTAGYTKYTCEDCGYEMFDNYVAPLGHQMDSHVVTAPTCTTAGWTTHSCTRTDCGYSYIDSVTEATGHDYESAITTEPTCEADGVKTYTCKNCAADVDGHSYTETLPKTGHVWGEWVTTKNPTATAEGEKTRTCANANCPIHTETVTLPKLGHTMVAGDIKVQPTCTTTGVQEYVCTEHTGDAACGYTYEVTLPALGHDWNDGEITTPATCTTDGEKTYTCKRDDCDATRTEVVPKTGHDMETAVTEATCVSDKFTTYTCKTCGYSYVINETGTALGHTFSVVVESVDATCEGKGYTIYKCERCDQTKTETTEALGHDWGEWKTTTPATCSERGVETRTCKNNPNHIQTRRTNTVDHDFVSTLYHPTCTESGFTILACKGCGKTIRTDFVPAYGHKYDEGVYEDATCTTPGGIRYTCTNTNPNGTPCGHSYLVKDTEPLGHIWGAWHYVEHPTVKDAYAKQRDCTRGTCTAIEYERGKMANEDDINVYYKVEFFNPWTTDTYYELNNGRTKLAKTYKTAKVNEAYYLVGDEVTYPSNILPKREKDYTWGGYKLIDWTYDEVGQTDSALNDMKSITKNMTVYAEFEGYDVYYKVAFWSEGTRLTIDEVILHGHAAQYPFDSPKKDENLQYKYEFTGWDYDYTAVYDSVAICAKYKQIAKSYNIVYCDWNGTELASETFQYGAAAKNNPTGLTKTADATYIYEFSGKWQTQPGKEEYIDLNHLTVPVGTKEGDTIKVYAKYYHKAKNYTVNIHGYGINKEIIPGATVQIFNSSGQIVTTTKLDENSDVTINLTYDTSYQIMIVDDSGNVGVKDVELNTSMKDETTGMLRPTEVTIYLDKYEEPDHGGSDCHCICHSFLGRFWISILNLIYRLTGRKIVCCYDMYATHGDQLIYGK